MVRFKYNLVRIKWNPTGAREKEVFGSYQDEFEYGSNNLAVPSCVRVSCVRWYLRDVGSRSLVQKKRCVALTSCGTKIVCRI